jgi:ParB/RepB/Spo0J family partition protein
MTEIHQLPIDQLHDSPFNPRRAFKEAGLEELAADIRANGVHSPITVRPILANVLRPDGEVSGYELVFGHRRLRAARLAGLTHMPCQVRALNADECRRLQISENLAREDVHPIEEAEGYAALMQHHDVTAEQLVQQTGKSRSYIYGRLKLATLVPEAREQYLAGTFGGEVALLIARLPSEKAQLQALNVVKEHHYRFGQGYRYIRSELLDKFTLGLKTAIFDTADALLVAAAGACTTCPKRSGNAPLFEDLIEKPADRAGQAPWQRESRPGSEQCTDPDCFAEKKKAHLKLQAAELEAKGKTVVDGNKARAAISAQGEVKGDYIALKDVRTALKKATGAKPQVVTIQDPRSGKTVEAVKRADLKASGVQLAEPAGARSGDSWEKKQKARQEQGERYTAMNVRLLRAIREHQAGLEPGLWELRQVAKAAWDDHAYSDNGATLLELWNLKHVSDMQGRLDKMDAAELTRLLLDCALARDVEGNGWHGQHTVPAALQAAAEHYGIDVASAIAEPDDEAASTPSTAARAPSKAKAARTAKKPSVSLGALMEAGKDAQQTDDAGSAGGSDAQGELLEGAAA